MELTINDRAHTLPAQATDPAMPLLWVLRDVLNLTGTKFGCGVSACGAGNASRATSWNCAFGMGSFCANFIGPVTNISDEVR